MQIRRTLGWPFGRDATAPPPDRVHGQHPFDGHYRGKFRDHDLVPLVGPNRGAGRRLRAFRLLASNEINPKRLTPHRDFDLSDCFSKSIFFVENRRLAAEVGQKIVAVDVVLVGAALA